MNVVIQQVDTREFLAEPPDDWVRDPHDAMLFTDTRAAVAFCRRHDLDNVRLVLFLQNRKVCLLRYLSGSKTPVPAGMMKAAA